MRVLSGFLTTLFAIGAVIIVLVIAAAILVVIGKWHVLKKLGKRPWAALIPFFSDYEMACGVEAPQWLTIAFPIVQGVYFVLQFGASNSVITKLMFVADIVLLCMFCHFAAKRFGKSDGWTVGLVLLGFVFWMVLGFGSATPVSVSGTLPVGGSKRKDGSDSPLDGVRSTWDRGVASASRGVESKRLKSQLNDANKRRAQLAAQLGASLYGVTKDNLTFRAGREALYDSIASVDAERADIQARIDEIERAAAESAEAATIIECPFCHTRMSASDLFCAGCGKPVAEIKAAIAAAQASEAPAPEERAAESKVGSAGEDALDVQTAPSEPVCPNCGEPVGEDDAFCMFCGAKLR